MHSSGESLANRLVSTQSKSVGQWSNRFHAVEDQSKLVEVSGEPKVGKLRRLENDFGAALVSEMPLVCLFLLANKSSGHR